jgi:hypothetical protein
MHGGREPALTFSKRSRACIERTAGPDTNMQPKAGNKPREKFFQSKITLQGCPTCLQRAYTAFLTYHKVIERLLHHGGQVSCRNEAGYGPVTEVGWQGRVLCPCPISQLQAPKYWSLLSPKIGNGRLCLLSSCVHSVRDTAFYDIRSCPTYILLVVGRNLTAT